MAEVDENKQVEVAIPADEPVTVDLGEPVSKGEQVGVDKSAPDEREAALAELRQQIEAEKSRAERERQAREQAERYAYEQETAAKTARVEVKDSNLRVILNAIEATEQAASAAERAYADAMAGADYQSAAKAQRAMAQAESQLLQLKNGKAAIEDQLQEAGKPDSGPRIDRMPRSSDPVEDMAATLTPKSAAWLRAHPDAAKNVNRLVAAHQAAVELEGIEPESPEYFAFIEGKLGIGEPVKVKDTKSSPAKAMASAPVSSSSSSSVGGRSYNGSTMTLSPAEVEFAVLNEPGMPRQKAIEVYARNKAALIREGKING